MNHPAEGTSGKADKAAELKRKLAAAKSEGGNGQTAAAAAAAVPTNGGAGKMAPAKKKGAKPKAEAKAPKTPAKTPAKTPVKAKAPAKAPASDRTRTMDRDKDGDGLRPTERDIMKIVKQRRGKPISIRDVAVAMFGENKVKAADEGVKKDNVLVRVVRNGIRKPREYGLLKLWTETGDPEAKNGFVMVSDGTPPPAGAAKKARSAAKAAAKTPKTPAKKAAATPAKKKPAKKANKGSKKSK